LIPQPRIRRIPEIPRHMILILLMHHLLSIDTTHKNHTTMYYPVQVSLK